MIEEEHIKLQKHYNILKFNKKINELIKQQRKQSKDWWNTSVKNIDGIYL